MQLVVPTDQRGELDQVISVESEIITGVYAPCTTAGTVVVNGIGCSCYAAVQHEDAHRKMQYISQPLSHFPSAANQGCHGVVGCLRMRLPRMLVLSKNIPSAPIGVSQQIAVA